MAIMATAAQDQPVAQDQPAAPSESGHRSWFGFHSRKSKSKHEDQPPASAQDDNLPWFGGGGHKIRRHHIDTRMYRINYGQYGWLVVVRTDAFTGDVQCFVSTRKSATQDRVTYADRTLGFAFDTYVDPNTTWFRADDNPAQRLSAVYPTLYARGQVVPPRSLDNLTKTTVLIPMESVEGADHIKIRIDDKVKPRTFRLIGFSEALETATAHGCVDGHYVRQPFPSSPLF